MKKLFIILSIALLAFAFTAPAMATDGWNFDSFTGQLGIQGLTDGHNPTQSIVQEMAFDFSATGPGEGSIVNGNLFNQQQGHGEGAGQEQTGENNSSMELFRPLPSFGQWTGTSYTNQYGNQIVDPCSEVPTVGQEMGQGSGTTLGAEGPGSVGVCNTNAFQQIQGVEGLAGMIQNGITSSWSHINRPGEPPCDDPQ